MKYVSIQTINFTAVLRHSALHERGKFISFLFTSHFLDTSMVGRENPSVMPLSAKFIYKNTPREYSIKK